MANTTIYTAHISGTNLRFNAPANTTLLQAVDAANTPGLRLSSSCRNGTCRACMCQLLSGQVAYQIEWPGLSFDEKRDGFVLPCVAYPVSDVTILPGRVV